MTAFFVPGIAPGAGAAENAYDRMREETELQMGRRPTDCRILSVWTRRGNVDCVTQVGRRDPLRGGTVMAIFDLGANQPFVVWWRQDSQDADGVREVLGNSAYSVLEFDG